MAHTANASGPASVSETPFSGAAVLRRSGENRDLAFTPAERRQLRLTGLLPAAVETLALQAQRVRLQLAALPNDVQRHLLLRDVRERNEQLFFHLCQRTPEEFLPLIYTPTIGAICLRYSELWRSPRVRVAATSTPLHARTQHLTSRPSTGSAGRVPAFSPPPPRASVLPPGRSRTHASRACLCPSRTSGMSTPSWRTSRGPRSRRSS